MKEFTQIENYQVEIWRRAYQRSLNLRVRPDGRLRVTCGRGVSRREINRFVFESRGFIDQRILQYESLRLKFPSKQYLNGEELLFLGQATPLDVVWTWRSRVKVSVENGRMELLAPLASNRADRLAAIQTFFRHQARLHLQERMEWFAARMKLSPAQLSIRGQTTRWGSCSARGEISLNWKLLACPLTVIDYVVVHELAHIRHLNHSAKFWGVVQEFHPEWKGSRRWLKDHEYEIAAQFSKT